MNVSPWLSLTCQGWLPFVSLNTTRSKCESFNPSIRALAGVYGVSANRDTWWNNRHAAHLGFTPQDSSEGVREIIERQPALASNDPDHLFQGGAFSGRTV
ncbi:hypothetical protein [Pseudomonas yamanorum]|uniref:hypothetical protein n=1 Tax=Pseudomonas yamanorum TaxID=515393 RepID=UPI003F73E70D